MRVVALHFLALAALVAGCARQPVQLGITLDDSALGPSFGRVGVIMTPLPKVEGYFPGALCLLCVAAAHAAHASLTNYLQTLPQEDLAKLKDEVASRIRNRGVEALIIGEDLKLDELADMANWTPNVAPKDFTPLKARYKVDKLMVIDVSALGVHRAYQGYVATGIPQIVVEGKIYLVNLSTNRYELYRTVWVSRAVEGQWDEGPKYPGITKTYFHTLQVGRDDFLQPFPR